VIKGFGRVDPCAGTSLENLEGINFRSEISISRNEALTNEQLQLANQKQKEDSDIIALNQNIPIEVTYYSREQFPGTTASGIRANTLDFYLSHGSSPVQCAVDPDFIPLGTEFTIILNGVEIPCIAADTGGSIRGNKIDIYVESTDDAYTRGAHEATATIP
jgi:3D (Asp-Asp-Asp) domain-containing protein